MQFKQPQFLQKEFRYQYLAAFLVNLSAFIYGVVIGFTGPNLELFKSAESPLAAGKITQEEESWISSLPAFGAIGFILLFGYISERLGRKAAILFMGIPQAASWVLMSYASTVNHIYVSRLFSGISGAGVFYIVPVYIAEISDKRIRGSLSTSFSVICNTGILVEFILAEYLDFRVAAVLIAIVSFVFLLGMVFMPESPQYLILKKRFDEAEIAFKFLRGLKPNEHLSESAMLDFLSIREIAKDEEEDEAKLTALLKHLAKPGILKGAVMAFFISLFPLFSGSFVIATFNQGIFKAADISVLSVYWSSFSFASIQIIASLFTAQFVDNVGRRKILIGSSFSSGFCLAIFAAYMFLKTETDLNLSSVPWITLIPLTSLLVGVFVSSIGIIPVPSFYAPEILDQKIRGLVMTCCSLWSWIAGFFMIKYYPFAESSIGLHSCILFYAFTCCLCGFYTLNVLPETKGRNIEDIAKSIGECEEKPAKTNNF